MRELHLFAGYGGGILGGMLLGHRCVGAVEINPYCRSVLEARQREGVLEHFPIHDDIKTIDARSLRGQVDIVCAGWPCQPFSAAAAGRRLGRADPRYLWPEIRNVVCACRPAFVFGENVAREAFRDAFGDLRAMGYRVAPLLRLGARDVGAPFDRYRYWMLAKAADVDRDRQHAVTVDAEVASTSEPRDPDGSGLEVRQGKPRNARTQQPPVVRATWRPLAPRLRRLVSGCAGRVESRRERITAAGNAQVPAVAATAFRILMGCLATAPRT